MLLAMRGTGMIAGFYVAGRMGKVDPRISMTIGFALIGLSGFALAYIDLNVTPEHVALAGLLQGVGSGILWVPVTTAAFWSLSPQLLPDGAAMFHLLRNIGQSVFIALSFLVVVRTTQINYADLVRFVNPFNELLGYEYVMGAWSTESARGLGALSGEISRQARMIAFNNAFLLYGFACFAVVPVVYLWRKTPVPDRS